MDFGFVVLHFLTHLAVNAKCYLNSNKNNADALIVSQQESKILAAICAEASQICIPQQKNASEWGLIC